MMSTWGNPLDQLKNEQRLQECLHYLQNNQTCTFNTRTGFSQQKLHKFNHESAMNLSKREMIKKHALKNISQCLPKHSDPDELDQNLISFQFLEYVQK